MPPFAVEYAPPLAFPVALVSEVRAPALRGAVDDPFFLPHLSLGYFREAHDPEPLRRAIEPSRETSLGASVVTEVHRVEVPVGRSRFLEPWTVLETVALEAPR
ncbi:MAG: hypothetical protein ICV67_01235 [Thermoleophilia bacterium]|nr:hypothetical protein [Thermoleophilia bacterium]